MESIILNSVGNLGFNKHCYLIKKKLCFAKFNTDIDAGRDNFIEIFGEGGHAPLLRKILCHGNIQKLLQDAHQPGIISDDEFIYLFP